MKAIQQYDPSTATATAISFTDLERMATAIARSGLFGVKDPAQAIALCLLAHAEGLHPAIAARDYNVIQGRPAKTAEAIQRTFQSAGGTIEWHTLTDEVADATFSHPQGGTFRCVWDMDRARRAGLAGKDMYKKYPRPLLRSRCISEGCRTVFPGSTSGMYTPEEVRDMPEKEVQGTVVSMTTPAQFEPPIGSGSPAHKSIEARITELGLNRDGVKLHVKRTYKVDHFPDLTATQQRELMATLPRKAVEKMLKQIPLLNADELRTFAESPPEWLLKMEAELTRVLDAVDAQLAHLEKTEILGFRLTQKFEENAAEQIDSDAAEKQIAG